MEKKYILTDKTVQYRSHTLHQIQAIRSFSDINEGDLGGWIEKENNLFQFGNSWIFPNSIVMDDAFVRDNAIVKGYAQIYGDATICDNAIIDGNIVIFDTANICDNAKVTGAASICGHALVFNYATVEGGSYITANSRIGGYAVITNGTTISGNAKILSDGYIQNSRDYLVIGPAGRSDHYTTFYRTKNKEIHVTTGCFVGSLEEFRKEVKKTHRIFSYNRADYLAMARFAKRHFRKEGAADV